MSDQAVHSLLVIVLDTNPAWWGGGERHDQNQITLSHCVNCVCVLANSHLMLEHKNRVAVIAAHTDKSMFLYPRPSHEQQDGVRVVEGGQYEVFTQLEHHLKTHTKQLVQADKDNLEELTEEMPKNCLIAGALAKALCYINRVERESRMREKLSHRILVIKGSQDCPSQYMNFMNAVFAAQKQNISIDACILDSDSGLMQQACDITGGIYLKIRQASALLQYLLWVFLPDPSVRCQMALPPKAQVDYRAACFCHRNLVDVGYVCSVCLSIYCSFSPICSTCQTTFKIIAKKKIKKGS